MTTSGAYTDASHAQVNGNLQIHNENHIHPYSVNESQQGTISWQALIKCVKAKYIQDNKIKTGFNEAREIEKCYVNLAIVEEKEQKIQEKSLNQDVSSRKKRLNSYEEIYGAKTSILVQDIFKCQSSEKLKRQLILGRAGIGKSVLCHYLAYQWAKEAWWQEGPFKLLVWIPLRLLTNESIFPKEGKDISLGKVFYELYGPQLNNKVPGLTEKQWINTLDKLIAEQGSDILYVLDGFDEVANICQLKEKQATRQTKILCSLFTQEQYIITSRPYYIDHYLSSQGINIDRRLENIGFIDKDIENYIQHYPWRTPTQSETLQKLLINNIDINGIAHIPINLALICRYWCTRNIKDESNFYINLTTLYKGLLADLLYEHLGKESGKGEFDFVDESGLDVLESESVQPILRFLEKLAFLQMQEDTLIISNKRINSLLKESKLAHKESWLGFKKVLEAGLLVSSDEKEKHFEERRDHYFIHLTFQEFLAAGYIAHAFKQEEEEFREVDYLEKKKSNEKITKRSLNVFIQKHKYDLRYEIAWWFVAGLLKEHRLALEQFFKNLLTEPCDLSQSFDGLLWIKCLEECELFDNLNSTLKNDLLAKIKTKTQVFLNSEKLIAQEKYSREWFNYLYSSPLVLKTLGILQTKKDLKKSLDILSRQTNLPIAILSTLIDLLKSKEVNIRSLAQQALAQQASLPTNILSELVTLLCDLRFTVRKEAREVLGSQKNLPVSILNKLMNLLNSKNIIIRKNALIAFSGQENLLAEVVDKMISLLNDKSWFVRKAALECLNKRIQLLGNASSLEALMDLMINKKATIKKVILEKIGVKNDIPIDMLNVLINLLSNKKLILRKTALELLTWQWCLPVDIVNTLIDLLHNKKAMVREAALEVLSRQRDLSINVLKVVVNLLIDKEITVRRKALKILSSRGNLSGDILNRLVDLMISKETIVENSMFKDLNNQTDFLVENIIKELLFDTSKSAKDMVLEALNGRVNLSKEMINLLGDLPIEKNIDVKNRALIFLVCQNRLSVSVLIMLISLLSDEKRAVRKAALVTLIYQRDLPVNIMDVLENLLRDEEESVRKALLSDLVQIEKLPVNILNMLMSLLSNKEIKVRKEALESLVLRRNLSIDASSAVVSLLNNKEEMVKRETLFVLEYQPSLSSNVLNALVELLNDKNNYVRKSSLSILAHQQNLPLDILINLVNCLSDENSYMKRELLDILDKKWDLFPRLPNQIANLLNCKEAEIRWAVLRILINRRDLPEKIVGYLIDNMNVNEEDWYYARKVNFINNYFSLIWANQKLQLKLFSMLDLLSDVILKNNFSSKNIIYFKNDQLLNVKLEQQFKQIVIRDKEKFIQVFNERYNVWLNKQKHSIIYDSARAKFEAKNYAGAIADYTEVLNLGYSDDKHCYALRGWSKMLNKNYSGAIMDASRTIFLRSDLGPDKTKNYLNRAWAYLFDSQFALALKDAEQALQLNKDLGEAYCIYSLIHFKLGALNEAIAIYKQQVVISEIKEGYPAFILAQLYRYQGNEENYQAMLTRANQLGDSRHLFSLLEEWMRIQASNLPNLLSNQLDMLSLEENDNDEEQIIDLNPEQPMEISNTATLEQAQTVETIQLDMIPSLPILNQFHRSQNPVENSIIENKVSFSFIQQPSCCLIT